MTGAALLSQTRLCATLQYRNWRTFGQLICNWKVSSSSEGAANKSTSDDVIVIDRRRTGSSGFNWPPLFHCMGLAILFYPAGIGSWTCFLHHYTWRIYPTASQNTTCLFMRRSICYRPNDNQLYIRCQPEDAQSAVLSVQQCVSVIEQWMESTPS